MDRFPSLPASEAQAHASGFAMALVNALDALNATQQTLHIALTPAQAGHLTPLPPTRDRLDTFEAVFLLYLADHYVIVPDARPLLEPTSPASTEPPEAT